MEQKDFFSEILARAKNGEYTDDEYNEIEKKREQQELERFQANADIPKMYLKASIHSELYTEEERTLLKQYVEDVKNGGNTVLILLGDVGRGKTYTCFALMNELQFGTYINMAQLEEKLETAGRYDVHENKEMLLSKYKKCRLFILDEAGRFNDPKTVLQERKTIFKVFDDRYSNDRPYVISSNLNPKEFAEYLGTALTDRLRGRNIKIIFTGESKRGM